MTDVETDVAMVLALARKNIPPDIQELLLFGNPMRGIPPGALRASFATALAALNEAGYVVERGWQPIETAPKDGTEFMATNGVLLGIGKYYTLTEPETVIDWPQWQKSREMTPVPNPKAGEVKHWHSASAFYAFDGEAETHDYEGPISFPPTYWRPLPAMLSAAQPAPKSAPENERRADEQGAE